MRRRQVIRLLGASAAAWPFTVAAGRSRPMVGVLMPYPDTDAEVRGRVIAFREELRRLGWPDSAVHIEERWATDDLDRVRAEAAELIRLEPDVIFFTGGRVAPILQEQTRTIPSVFVGVSDPLGQGLVPSLARPGGTSPALHRHRIPLPPSCLRS